jgi:rubrerythrin
LKSSLDLSTEAHNDRSERILRLVTSLGHRSARAHLAVPKARSVEVRVRRPYPPSPDLLPTDRNAITRAVIIDYLAPESEAEAAAAAAAAAEVSDSPEARAEKERERTKARSRSVEFLLPTSAAQAAKVVIKAGGIGYVVCSMRTAEVEAAIAEEDAQRLASAPAPAPASAPSPEAADATVTAAAAAEAAAAAAAAAAADVLEPGQWRCGQCTYVNPGEAHVCEVCGSMNAGLAWACAGCTYVNPSTAAK